MSLLSVIGAPDSLVTNLMCWADKSITHRRVDDVVDI